MCVRYIDRKQQYRHYTCHVSCKRKKNGSCRKKPTVWFSCGYDTYPNRFNQCLFLLNDSDVYLFHYSEPIEAWPIIVSIGSYCWQRSCQTSLSLNENRHYLKRLGNVFSTARKSHCIKRDVPHLFYVWQSHNNFIGHGTDGWFQTICGSSYE